MKQKSPSKIKGYLRLMRPANIITSVADVAAGITLSGFFQQLSEGNRVPLQPVLALMISTIGLYGGGVVFNDVFDARLDGVERPERPIPSGLVSIGEAALLGSLLLLAGMAAAWIVNPLTGFISIGISLAALMYDKWGKHHSLLGPLNMGLCRGLNLLLGMEITAHAPGTGWLMALIPVIYIGAITTISRGEVHGGKKEPLYLAALLYGLVIGSILYFAAARGTIPFTLLFLLFFAWMIFQPLAKAIREPAGRNIGKAVRGGVIALIIMDASWAAAVGSVPAAVGIILLLPISLWLAGLFAVT